MKINSNLSFLLLKGRKAWKLLRSYLSQLTQSNQRVGPSDRSLYFSQLKDIETLHEIPSDAHSTQQRTIPCTLRLSYRDKFGPGIGDIRFAEFVECIVGKEVKILKDRR